MLLLTIFAMAMTLRDRGYQAGNYGIELSVGLPPIQYNALAGRYRKKLVDYYAVDYIFRHNRAEYCLNIPEIKVYPQGFSALFASLEGEKPLILELAKEPNAFLVDIGSGTVDVIGVEYGRLSEADEHLFTSFNECYQRIRISAIINGYYGAI
ncbi:MAG: hypothetical protein LBC56_07035 [Oscillospiraceae bacterium]|jgi:hypothetical protein|nr:hypothetical protein [Oscillospiraceae bacterium]